MQDADTFGLGQMPKVDPIIASFVSLQKVLRPNVHCPRPQLSDYGLSSYTGIYNTAACMGRIGNSLSHLMLALSQSLSLLECATTQDLTYATLQSIAFMTRELGQGLCQHSHRHADKSGLHNHPCLRPVGKHWGTFRESSDNSLAQLHNRHQSTVSRRIRPDSSLQTWGEFHHLAYSTDRPLGPWIAAFSVFSSPADSRRSQPQHLERSLRVRTICSATPGTWTAIISGPKR